MGRFAFLNIYFETVPIIPTFLYDLNHNNQTSSSSSSPSTSSAINSATQATIGFISNFTKDFSDNCRGEFEEWLAKNYDTFPVTTDSSSEKEYVESSKLSSGQQLRHDELVNENSEVGIMFASKPVVQAITNLFVGPLTAKYFFVFFVKF